MEISILYHWKYSQENWFHSELKKRGISVQVFDIPEFDQANWHTRVGKMKIKFQFVKLALHALRQTRENDTLITWTFSVGVITSLAAIVLGKKRRILSIGLIADQKGRFAEIVRNRLCSIAFRRGLIATCNSEQYLAQYDRMFHLNGKKCIFVLNDPINKETSDALTVTKPAQAQDGGYCFSGGEANRDWEMLVECARQRPDIPFKIVTRKSKWNICTVLPPNIELIFDTTEEKFFSYVRHSNMVILPLKSMMSCGLIVLIRSILMGKLVIATWTPSTAPYFPKEAKRLLVPPGSAESILKNISAFYLSNPERNRLISLTQEYILEHFNYEVTTEKIVDILKKNGMTS